MSYPVEQLERGDFPPLLQEIPDAPSLLYMRGHLPGAQYTPLCVVGSRALSGYGRRVCSSLIAGLAGSPVAIISGMALGADSAAHIAALDTGLPTVAVLPSSVDDKSIYPSSNKPLAKRILDSGGALISEYEPSFTAMTHSFPARNRIMAGMSLATLVIEAGEKSGTLITVRLALDYNREVLAVPHEILREGGKGTNTILRQGATLVRDSSDILEALGLARKLEQKILPTDLSVNELAIYEALSEALLRDELVVATDLSVQEVNVALSSLLIRGLILERLGKIERA